LTTNLVLPLKDVLTRFTQEAIEVIKGHSVDDALKAALLRGASILFLTNNKQLTQDLSWMLNARNLQNESMDNL